MVFVGYFSQVIDGLLSDTLNKVAATGLFISAVVTVIILEIALHIVIAVFSQKDADRPHD